MRLTSGEADSTVIGVKPILFYDGTCALCHGLVRWVIARDPAGIFAFAPLQGATFQQLVALQGRVTLPDSVVVRDEDGKLWTRSDAVIFLLRRIGRPRLAGILGIMPRAVRNLGYGFVAKVRYAIFGRKQEMCPLMPAAFRSRFLD